MIALHTNRNYPTLDYYIGGVTLETKTRVPKAFISSTSKDIYEYREAAINTCLRLGLQPIAMEHFEAMGMGATEGSKLKLDEADLYIGIFAHRYGYIEPPNNIGVTEIEFDYAAERDLERLCFLVHPSYPWSPDAIDYINYSKLLTFKDRIEKTVIRTYFTTVDDFTAKLIQGLVSWQQRNSRVSTVLHQESSLSTLRAVPPRPSMLIGRDNDIFHLKARFGISSSGIDTEKIQEVTVVRGWPGVGKTTLVTALAHDSGVATAFPDGILWIHLGEKANPLSGLLNWARALGIAEVDKMVNLEETMGYLRAVLLSKRMLLIVDDVWNLQDAAPFKIGGPKCALLFTTRFPNIARNLVTTSSDVYLLGVLSEDHALDLLQRLAPTIVQQFPAESRGLVHDLEGLPLAIRVAGRMLETEASLGVDVLSYITELQNSNALLTGIAPDDRFDPKTGTTPTVQLLLKRSTDTLDDVTRERFAFLGAFAPKPATFDLNAMKAVWLVPDPIPTVRLLVDRGLLEPIISTGRFQIHALLVMHAKSLLDDEE